MLLTRELGKNDKMISSLQPLGFKCLEVPLIEHSDGPDRQKLPEVLKTSSYDWVAITSPEAAAVLLEAWEQAGKPKMRVAVVGAGSGEILEASGIKPDFVPSKATGKVMGAELPKIPGGTNSVLFPASVKASTDLQDALAANGFTVTRMSTYNTSGVTSVPPEVLKAALEAEVVTFGSPSAVKAWVALVGLQAASERLNVCIGSTSAKACDSAGLPKSRVYFPASPGIPGWVGSVVQACQENGLHVAAPAAV